MFVVILFVFVLDIVIGFKWQYEVNIWMCIVQVLSKGLVVSVEQMFEGLCDNVYE